MDVPFYELTTMTTEEAAEYDRVYGGLTAATRRLADAQLRTLVDPEEAEAVTAEIDALADRLLRHAREGALGTQLGPGRYELRNHGNSVSGLRNPFATISRKERRIDADRHVHYDVELGAMYEGPPGLVHGGVSALLLDELLGDATAVGGSPGMTGRLTVHYRRPTPLGRLSLEGWLEHSEGRKSTVRGQIRTPSGEVTVEAEGLFILPRRLAEEWRGHGFSLE